MEHESSPAQARGSWLVATRCSRLPGRCSAVPTVVLTVVPAPFPAESQAAAPTEGGSLAATRDLGPNKGGRPRG